MMPRILRLNLAAILFAVSIFGAVSRAAKPSDSSAIRTIVSGTPLCSTPEFPSQESPELQELECIKNCLDILKYKLATLVSALDNLKSLNFDEFNYHNHLSQFGICALEPNNKALRGEKVVIYSLNTDWTLRDSFEYEGLASFERPELMDRTMVLTRNSSGLIWRNVSDRYSSFIDCRSLLRLLNAEEGIASPAHYIARNYYGCDHLNDSSIPTIPTLPYFKMGCGYETYEQFLFSLDDMKEYDEQDFYEIRFQHMESDLSLEYILFPPSFKRNPCSKILISSNPIFDKPSANKSMAYEIFDIQKEYISPALPHQNTLRFKFISHNDRNCIPLYRDQKIEVVFSTRTPDRRILRNYIPRSVKVHDDYFMVTNGFCKNRAICPMLSSNEVYLAWNTPDHPCMLGVEEWHGCSAHIEHTIEISQLNRMAIIDCNDEPNCLVKTNTKEMTIDLTAFLLKTDPLLFVENPNRQLEYIKLTMASTRPVLNSYSPCRILKVTASNSYNPSVPPVIIYAEHDPKITSFFTLTDLPKDSAVLNTWNFTLTSTTTGTESTEPPEDDDSDDNYDDPDHITYCEFEPSSILFHYSLISFQYPPPTQTRDAPQKSSFSAEDSTPANVLEPVVMYDRYVEDDLLRNPLQTKHTYWFNTPAGVDIKSGGSDSCNSRALDWGYRSPADAFRIISVKLYLPHTQLDECIYHMRALATSPFGSQSLEEALSFSDKDPALLQSVQLGSNINSGATENGIVTLELLKNVDTLVGGRIYLRSCSKQCSGAFNVSVEVEEHTHRHMANMDFNFSSLLETQSCWNPTILRDTGYGWEPVVISRETNYFGDGDIVRQLGNCWKPQQNPDKSNRDRSIRPLDSIRRCIDEMYHLIPDYYRVHCLLPSYTISGESIRLPKTNGIPYIMIAVIEKLFQDDQKQYIANMAAIMVHFSINKSAIINSKCGFMVLSLVDHTLKRSRFLASTLIEFSSMSKKKQPNNYESSSFAFTRIREHPINIGDHFMISFHRDESMAICNIDQLKAKELSFDIKFEFSFFGGLSSSVGGLKIMRPIENSHHKIHPHRPNAIHPHGANQMHNDGGRPMHNDGANQMHKDGGRPMHNDGANQMHKDGERPIHNDGANQMHKDGPNPIHNDGANPIHNDDGKTPPTKSPENSIDPKPNKADKGSSPASNLIHLSYNIREADLCTSTGYLPLAFPIDLPLDFDIVRSPPELFNEQKLFKDFPCINPSLYIAKLVHTSFSLTKSHMCSLLSSASHDKPHIPQNNHINAFTSMNSHILFVALNLSKCLETIFRPSQPNKTLPLTLHLTLTPTRPEFELRPNPHEEHFRQIQVPSSSSDPKDQQSNRIFLWRSEKHYDKTSGKNLIQSEPSQAKSIVSTYKGTENHHSEVGYSNDIPIERRAISSTSAWRPCRLNASSFSKTKATRNPDYIIVPDGRKPHQITKYTADLKLRLIPRNVCSLRVKNILDEGQEILFLIVSIEFDDSPYPTMIDIKGGSRAIFPGDWSCEAEHPEFYVIQRPIVQNEDGSYKRGRPTLLGPLSTERDYSVSPQDLFLAIDVTTCRLTKAFHFGMEPTDYGESLTYIPFTVGVTLQGSPNADQVVSVNEGTLLSLSAHVIKSYSTNPDDKNLVVCKESDESTDPDAMSMAAYYHLLRESPYSSKCSFIVKSHVRFSEPDLIDQSCLKSNWIEHLTPSGRIETSTASRFVIQLNPTSRIVEGEHSYLGILSVKLQKNTDSFDTTCTRIKLRLIRATDIVPFFCDDNHLLYNRTYHSNHEDDTIQLLTVIDLKLSKGARLIPITPAKLPLTMQYSRVIIEFYQSGFGDRPCSLPVEEILFEFDLAHSSKDTSLSMQTQEQRQLDQQQIELAEAEIRDLTAVVPVHCEDAHKLLKRITTAPGSENSMGGMIQKIAQEGKKFREGCIPSLVWSFFAQSPDVFALNTLIVDEGIITIRLWELISHLEPSMHISMTSISFSMSGKTGFKITHTTPLDGPVQNVTFKVFQRDNQVSFDASYPVTINKTNIPRLDFTIVGYPENIIDTVKINMIGNIKDHVMKRNMNLENQHQDVQIDSLPIHGYSKSVWRVTIPAAADSRLNMKPYCEVLSPLDGHEYVSASSSNRALDLTDVPNECEGYVESDVTFRGAFNNLCKWGDGYDFTMIQIAREELMWPDTFGARESQISAINISTSQMPLLEDCTSIKGYVANSADWMSRKCDPPDLRLVTEFTGELQLISGNLYEVKFDDQDPVPISIVRRRIWISLARANKLNRKNLSPCLKNTGARIEGVGLRLRTLFQGLKEVKSSSLSLKEPVKVNPLLVVHGLTNPDCAQLNDGIELVSSLEQAHKYLSRALNEIDATCKAYLSFALKTSASSSSSSSVEKKPPFEESLNITDCATSESVLELAPAVLPGDGRVSQLDTIQMYVTYSESSDRDSKINLCTKVRVSTVKRQQEEQSVCYVEPKDIVTSKEYPLNWVGYFNSHSHAIQVFSDDAPTINKSASQKPLQFDRESINIERSLSASFAVRSLEVSLGTPRVYLQFYMDNKNGLDSKKCWIPPNIVISLKMTTVYQGALNVSTLIIPDLMTAEFRFARLIKYQPQCHDLVLKGSSINEILDNLKLDNVPTSCKSEILVTSTLHGLTMCTDNYNSITTFGVQLGASTYFPANHFSAKYIHKLESSVMDSQYKIDEEQDGSDTKLTPFHRLRVLGLRIHLGSYLPNNPNNKMPCILTLQILPSVYSPDVCPIGNAQPIDTIKLNFNQPLYSDNLLIPLPPEKYLQLTPLNNRLIVSFHHCPIILNPHTKPPQIYFSHSFHGRSTTPFNISQFCSDNHRYQNISCIRYSPPRLLQSESSTSPSSANSLLVLVFTYHLLICLLF